MAHFGPYLLPAAAALLILAGCSRQQPQSVPAQREPPASVTPPQAAGSQQEIQVKSVGKNAQIVHIVKPGTVIAWSSPMQFYIHFSQAADFCEEPAVPRYAGFYAATKTETAGSVYRLQCTVKHDIPASREFTYEVLGKLPPKPPPPGLLLRTTPCGGCNEGTPPGDSGH